MSNSDVESLSFSDREDCSTDQIELPAPTNHNTAGRVLHDGISIEKLKTSYGNHFKIRSTSNLPSGSLKQRYPRSILTGILRKG